MVRDFKSDTRLTIRIASATEAWIPSGRFVVGGIGDNNSK